MADNVAWTAKIPYIAPIELVLSTLVCDALYKCRLSGCNFVTIKDMVLDQVEQVLERGLSEIWVA